MFLLLSLVDDGLRNSDGVINMIQIDFGMHVGVEEVTGFIVGKVFDIIIKPIEEGFTLCLIDDFFIWLWILFVIVIEIVFRVDEKSET